MDTVIVSIPVDRISDWNSFHEVFKDTLRLPDLLWQEYECVDRLHDERR